MKNNKSNKTALSRLIINISSVQRVFVLKRHTQLWLENTVSPQQVELVTRHLPLKIKKKDKVLYLEARGNWKFFAGGSGDVENSTGPILRWKRYSEPKTLTLLSLWSLFGWPGTPSCLWSLFWILTCSRLSLRC